MKNNNSMHYEIVSSLTAEKILAYCKSCGHFITTSDYHISREEYNAFLIVYLISGSFFYNTKNNSQRLNPGELGIFDTFSYHKYGTDIDSEFIWVHINGNGIKTILNELILINKSNIFSGTLIIGMRDFINSMIKLCAKNIEINEFDVSLMLYDSLYSLVSNKKSIAETFIKNKENEYITDSIKFIHNNYHKKITIKEIANSIHLSEAYFSRIFKASTGLSPYLYLKNYRINIAKILLEQGVSINETAIKTGWNSTSNFIYAFKKSVGLSPGNMQKNTNQIMK